MLYRRAYRLHRCGVAVRKSAHWTFLHCCWNNYTINDLVKPDSVAGNFCRFLAHQPTQAGTDNRACLRSWLPVFSSITVACNPANNAIIIADARAIIILRSQKMTSTNLHLETHLWISSFVKISVREHEIRARYLLDQVRERNRIVNGRQISSIISWSNDPVRNTKTCCFPQHPCRCQRV